MNKREQQIGSTFHASMPVTLAAAADKAGAVEAIVSAYDVDYRIGYFGRHRIAAGAFDESLAQQTSIPLFWEHDWTAGGLPIGSATGADVDEPKAGLKLSGRLYVESTEVARIHQALLDGAIREWSIGYRVLEAEYPEDDEALTIVRKAELLEASSVVRGANPDTETLKVASSNDGELRELVARMVREQLETEPAEKAPAVTATQPDPARLAALLSRPETRELLRTDGS